MLSRLKTKLFVTIVTVSAFSLLAAQSIFFYETKTNNNAYIQLIQVYKEWVDLEKKVSEMLTFRLSPIQISLQGQNLKLILEDNLGRKWIFKPDYTGIQNSQYWHYFYTKGKTAVIVYKIYKLFGLQTPRIYFTTLNINGNLISGGIQEFVSNQGTLAKWPPHQISPVALDYILKTNVLDWLTANHNSSPLHFLILSTDNYGEPDSLTRVDNESAFTLLGKDKLQSNWIPPWDKKPTLYYHWLWEDYILNKIKLNLAENISFVKFVSNFPDTLFEEIIQPKFENSNQKYRNLEYILSRKHNLVKDIKEFYTGLVKKRNEPIIFDKDTDYSKIAAAITENLIWEIKKLKQESLALQKSAKHPSTINIIYSFEGFQHLNKIYKTYWDGNRQDLISLCDGSLKKLSLLIARAENKYEKKALQTYQQEIKKIHSGKPASFPRDKITKAIGSIIPQN